jgi:hypothetical protein
MSRRNVTEANVAGQGPKERDPLSDEYRHAGDDETVNQAGPQKPLDCDPTIDVEMLSTTSSESRYDVSRRPGHLFNNASLSTR